MGGVAADQAKFIEGSGQLVAADGLTAGDGSVVTKEMDTTKWIYSAVDGYWYYNAVLASGVETDPFLKSITLNAATDMGVKGTSKYYTEKATRPDNDEIGTDPTTEWVPMPASGMPATTTFSRSVSSLEQGKTGYAGSDYSLFITYETYQATDAARDEAIAGGWDSTNTPSI